MSKRQKTGAVNQWLLAILMVAVSSAISWALIVNLSAPKGNYDAEIARINNTLGHMTDLATGLNNFTGFQNSKLDQLDEETRLRFTETDSAITNLDNTTATAVSALDGVSTLANDTKSSLETMTGTINDTKDSLDTLTSTVTDATASLDAVKAKVDGLAPGLVIIPSVTTTTSGGTISLSIQSDAARTVAFKVLFRPASDVARSEATFEAALKALYAAPTVNMTAGSAVRGDYSIYWNPADSKYYLRDITFMTRETPLVAGTQSKDITYAATGNATYQMLITPVYVTGSTTGSW